MTDIADIANDLVEERIQAALTGRPRFNGISATHCEVCDSVIPERRRNAVPGVQTCADCQSIAEKKAHRGLR